MADDRLLPLPGARLAPLLKALLGKGLAKSHIVFLDALLAPDMLQSTTFEIATSEARERLNQLRAADGNDPDLVSEGQRILLFSQLTSMLALIEEGIATLKIPVFVESSG